MTSITQREFAAFQRLMQESAGICLADDKHALVSGRLARRLQACGVENYAAYLQLLASGAAPTEVQTAVDLLTTNETYFFREPEHFEFLRAQAQAHRGMSEPFRAWSAATATGEEAYSIAMVLEEALPGCWQVLGSDVSVRVLARAQEARYPMQRLTHFPASYLRRFCLKGVGSNAGLLRIARRVRERIEFRHINLNEPLPPLGQFDVIFLRNVLIYFNAQTKGEVAARVAKTLKPGGHLLIGHSETLSGVTAALEERAPTVYRRALA